MSRLVVTVVVAFLAAVVCALDGMHLVDEDGNAIDDTTTKRVPRVEQPRSVAVATEGSLFSLQRDYEVVVLAVWQQYDCSGCETMLKQFAEAASRCADLPAYSARFATLDAVEEADEYSYLLSEHPDAHWMVPAVLVLKRQYIMRLRKPPINFLVNENLARDLPRFVERMVGPELPVVRTADAFEARMKSPATEGVAFALWPGSDFAFEAIHRVVDVERLHSFYMVVDRDLADDTAFAKKYNPRDDIFVAYFTRPDGSVDTKSTSLGGTSAFDIQIGLVRKFIEDAKLERPGHEFDNLRKLRTDDTAPDSGPCTRTSKDGDAIVVNIDGYSLHSGSHIVTIGREKVLVGKDRGDLPALLTQKSLAGLCPGMRRRVVFPPMQHYHEDAMPPGLGVEDRARFEIKVHDWADDETGSDGAL